MKILNAQMIDALINVIEKENSIYEDIAKLSKNKTDIIVKGKVAELENIVKIEQSLVLQIGKCEDAREKLVEALSKQLNLDPDKLTISELLKHLNQSQAQKLKNSQDKMAVLLKDLKNLNEMNSKLIKNSLEYIDFSMNLMTSVGVSNNNYGNNGQVGDSKKRNLFDVKL